MTPSIRQLQVLVQVYRTGNLTRAAAQLGLTQAAVSLQLQQLEQIFGLRLFDRTTRSLTPTAAASEAVTAAEHILASATDLTDHMRNLNSAAIGKVAFAASSGFACTFLPPILASFRKSNPGVEIVLYDVPAQQLIDRLMMTDAEFALGSLEGDMPDFIFEPILKGRLAAVGLNTGAFAARKQIAWDELSAHPTIAMRSETMIRTHIDVSLGKLGKTFRPTLEVSLFNSSLSMAAAGIGIAIQPEYIVSPEQFPTLIAKPLVRPSLTQQISLIRRRSRSLSPAAARFVQVTREAFRLRKLALMSN